MLRFFTYLLLYFHTKKMVRKIHMKNNTRNSKKGMLNYYLKSFNRFFSSKNSVIHHKISHRYLKHTSLIAEKRFIVWETIIYIFVRPMSSLLN